MIDTNTPPGATRRPVPESEFGGRLTDCFLLDLTVAEVVDRSARLRSITFLSSDLIGFGWAPGQDLMFEVPGGDDRTVRRRYTIRRSDPERGTLDIEAVLHGDGPFARWAHGATAGDRISAIGPRGAIGVRTDSTHHLFVGDETALPVTAAMLGALAPGAQGVAIIASEDEPPPATPDEEAITWVGPADVAHTLAAVELFDDTVAYLNGERSLVREAADVLTNRGLSPEAIKTKAYWRRDQANATHGEPGRD
jgi:NADPH-dependent ferric siderophore reductase